MRVPLFRAGAVAALALLGGLGTAGPAAAHHFVGGPPLEYGCPPSALLVSAGSATVYDVNKDDHLCVLLNEQSVGTRFLDNRIPLR